MVYWLDVLLSCTWAMLGISQSLHGGRYIYADLAAFDTSFFRSRNPCAQLRTTAGNPIFCISLYSSKLFRYSRPYTNASLSRLG